MGDLIAKNLSATTLPPERQRAQNGGWKLAKATVINLVNNPDYAKPQTKIQHPKNKTDVFGLFPAITTRGAAFPSGPIYLCHGEHPGRGLGFGLTHIWHSRFASCADYKDAIDLTVALIDSVLVRGAEIYYEYSNNGSAANRLSIFKRNSGVVVVERREFNGKDAYSIVTAIRTSKANGSKVGAI